MRSEKQKKEYLKLIRQNYKSATIKEKYYLNNVYRIGYLDIECTNLKGNMGYILSWCMLVRDTQVGGEKGRIIAKLHGIVTPRDINTSNVKNFEDKRIINELMEAIEEYKVDLLIGHYFHGAYRMDIPFIRTRCIMNKIKGFPKHKAIKFGDTHRMGKNGYSVHRNSLDAIGDAFGVSTKKTPVSGRLWQLAARGDKKALEYVLHHNMNDVIINWKIHLKMEEYTNIPSAYV